MLYNKRKIIKVDEHNVNIIVDYFGNNTAAFIADLPKNAIVTDVVVNGKSIVSPLNPVNEVTVVFPPNEEYEDKTVAAVLHSVYDGNAIIDAAKALDIKNFEVKYLEVAIVEE